MDSRSRLNDPRLTTIFFAILVKRLGGEAKITQADVDDIAFNRLNEHVNPDGSIEFELVQRPVAG